MDDVEYALLDAGPAVAQPDADDRGDGEADRQRDVRLEVVEVAPARFEDLVALRIALEIHAGARSLPHVSDVVIDDMAETDARIGMARRAGDLDRVAALNQTFHRGLYELPPDQASMPLIETVWLQLGLFNRLARENTDAVGVRDVHPAILAALTSRDCEALTAAIAHDIRSAVPDTLRT